MRAWATPERSREIPMLALKILSWGPLGLGLVTRLGAPSMTSTEIDTISPGKR